MTKPGDRVLYHPSVIKDDIPRLDRVSASKIKLSVEAKLATSPEIYGVPLRGTLKHYWKLRVGSYRVVYRINSKNIYVLVIAHRKDVYNISQRRN